MKIRYVLLLIVLILLGACAPGPHAVTEGTLRDMLYSVEPRINGSASIWMLHDDVGVYCTLDKEIVDRALELLRSPNPEVIIRYASINTGDPEMNPLIGASGCATEEREQITVYKILSLESVE